MTDVRQEYDGRSDREWRADALRFARYLDKNHGDEMAQSLEHFLRQVGEGLILLPPHPFEPIADNLNACKRCMFRLEHKVHQIVTRAGEPRALAYCRCGQCGRVSQCTPTFDFYARKEGSALFNPVIDGRPDSPIYCAYCTFDGQR